MCSLQRPLDTKSQVRIAAEAEAILNVIDLWKSGQVELISSPALVFETEQMKISARKSYILEILSKANLYIQKYDRINEQAQVFVESGIKPLDALHLAFSVEAAADYFCTCDDRFLKRAKKVDTSQTKVVSPLELIMELVQ
jgi:predicted nucleic acid-binding protein